MSGLQEVDELRNLRSLLQCGGGRVQNPRHWFDKDELRRIVEFIQRWGIGSGAGQIEELEQQKQWSERPR